MRLMWEGIRIAYRALFTNKLRTFLTLLGNIVGIMATIAVVSLLGGVDEYMRQEVADEGSNTFNIVRVDFFQAITDFDSFTDALKYNPRLERADVEALRRSLEHAEYVSGKVSQSARVGVYDKHLEDIDIRGRDAAYAMIENVPLVDGRHLTELEVRESAQVAVIGWEVHQQLFAPRNPIGKQVRIGGRHFRVIGVVADRGSLLGQSKNRFVIVPLGSYGKVFGANQSLSIQVKSADIRSLDLAIEEATVAMRTRHRLRPDEDNDFFISTSEQLITLWRSISSGVMIALVALVSISMVVGSIVLMNTMLVAVAERTREIGLRKALGARRIAIVWQFLVESATLSLFGGLVGIAIGFSIASLVSLVSVLPYTVNLAIIGIAFAVTVVLGLAAGTYPAVRAAQLDPVDALRAE